VTLFSPSSECSWLRFPFPDVQMVLDGLVKHIFSPVTISATQTCFACFMRFVRDEINREASNWLDANVELCQR